MEFVPSCLHHVEGELTGQPFILEPWQQAIVANLFGWKRRDQYGREIRRYRELFLYVPRKNGKSPLAAALALLAFFTDDELGQQNYMAAAEREQAGFLFRQARGMVDAEPELSSRCSVYGGNAQGGQSRSIVRDADGSFIKVLSADANTKHGGNAHLVLIDELHAQPSRDLYDVLATSMASKNRKQPMMVCITTADFLRESICNEKYDYACKVRDGLVADQYFLPVIYEALPTDDWKLPATWEKANPNIDVSVSRDYLEAEAKKAADNPAYENTFRRLHLNMRTEQDVRWLSLESWEACSTPIDEDELAGRACFAGLDLANTQDVAALALVFPPAEGEKLWHVIPRFWVPETACLERERKNKTRFDQWIRQGWMTQTQGNVIDYSWIRNEVNALSQKYLISKLAYDPYNATDIATQLMMDGLNVYKFTQCVANFNEACSKLEELLRDRIIVVGANPVLRWMASNVSVRVDGRGYKMPSRKASTEKIDGIVAMLQGIAVAIHEPDAGVGGIEIW